MAKKYIILPKRRKDYRCSHCNNLGEDNYCKEYPDEHRLSEYTYIEDPKTNIACVCFRPKEV